MRPRQPNVVRAVAHIAGRNYKGGITSLSTLAKGYIWGYIATSCRSTPLVVAATPASKSFDGLALPFRLDSVLFGESTSAIHSCCDAVTGFTDSPNLVANVPRCLTLSVCLRAVPTTFEIIGLRPLAGSVDGFDRAKEHSPDGRAIHCQYWDARTRQALRD
jgi:hypothetical protein